MRSDTRLDSAVFQLTPTRTRCDLVIIANGKTEKIASGLLNPFLSHLRTAQDQIAIGGYSIKLEPDPGVEAAWFTKGNVERFVRFVSTPEVLERVITIESEITQIDKAISIQGNDNLGLSTVEEYHQMKSIGSTEGNKMTFDANAEKAIILYKPGSHPNPPKSNGSKMHEENSKVQLLRVLESRKKVLQKEQAMAFARTAAAGFDIENMTHLISFAESFGASRLLEACTQYMQLWKGKHETGQWIDVEAAEALSYRSEFSPLNSSEVILSGDTMRQKEIAEMWPVSGIDTRVESNGNTTSQDNDKDKRFPSEPQVPRGLHEYYQGQFQHPAFPQWPILSQPGPHGFQPYPMQAMPYYQNYPMNGQFFQPPPTPMEDPRLKTPKGKAKKKRSINNKDCTLSSKDESDESTSEYEEVSSKSRSSDQKAGHSKKKKGVVVIQNLNYISGNRQETSGNGLESSNDSVIEENKDSLSENGGSNKKSLKSSKRRDNHTNSFDISNVHEKNDDMHSQEADVGNWQAFQSFLLRAEDKMTSVVNEEILAGEKAPPVNKGQNKNGPDPLFLPERDSNYPEESIMEYDVISGKGNRIKQVVSADEIISSANRGLQAKQIATHFKEIDGRAGYRKAGSDDFIMHGREKQVGSKISSNPLVDCVYEHGENFEKSSSHNVNDESFMVPFRLGSHDILGVDRRLTIGMDSKCPSIVQRNEDSLNKETTRVTYEPNDLTLMLGRRRESESAGYGPARVYDIQVPLVVKHESHKKEDDISASTNQGLMKTVREKKLKSSQGGLEKKRKDAMITKMASSKSTSLTEAQKRAGKLRNYKSDLQKLKKEHEEEEMKRLEALKKERQKRIAARSSSNPAQLPATPQQFNPRLPVKVTHSAYKSSKFRDSDPGSNSHLQRLPRNISSNGNNGSDKLYKTTRSNGFSHLASSFPKFNKECVKPEGCSASERIRRLSEPKGKEGMKKEGISTSERSRRLSEPKGSIVRNVSEKSVKNSIQVMKRPLPEVQPQSKKISAIIQLDRTKSETLPELKIKTYKTPSEAVKNKPTTKQQKGVGSKSYLNSVKKVEKTPSFSYSDENPVVEKTVVMLENEVVSVPPVQTSEGKIDSYRDVSRNKNGLDTGYTSIRALPSPIYGVEVDNSTEGDKDNRPNSYQDESERFFYRTVPEKPYRAPYTTASSLEDPAIDLCSVDKFNETQEKAQNNETKGLRKLWKFGRKGHSSGSGGFNIDSNASIDDHMMATSSSGYTSALKNLISKDESNMVGTQTKVSSSFSILAPFRGRNKEKKAAA